MVSSVQMEPVSRTDQYKRVMKPLLERKRRARINRCLDELRDLLVAALQAEGETVTRLEKADILELTVRHVKRLNQRRRLSVGSSPQDPHQDAFKFQQGFMAAAQQVQSFLMSTPALEPSASTRLMVHLRSCASAMATSSTSSHTPPPQPCYPHQDSTASSAYPIHNKCLPGVTGSISETASSALSPHINNIATRIVPPKSSPSVSPPPLIDLSLKSSNEQSSVSRPCPVPIIAPTPIRRESPVIFRDPSLPEDLSLKRDITREGTQDSRDAWRPW